MLAQAVAENDINNAEVVVNNIQQADVTVKGPWENEIREEMYNTKMELASSKLVFLNDKLGGQSKKSNCTGLLTLSVY